jgi:hypothetical protein
MKQCSKCKIEKELTEFRIKNKTTGILHSWCIICKNEYDRNFYNDNAIRKAQIRKNNIIQKKRGKEFIKEYKESHACSKCGEQRWYVLDFHHLLNKKNEIAELSRKGNSINSIKNEIEKCIVLCSNCHREEHYLSNTLGIKLK